MFKNKLYHIFRVDRGVHALHMPVTFDLQKNAEGDVFFDPKKITYMANNALKQMNLDIQVLKTVAIGGDFELRKGVKSRTYLYR